MRLAFIGFRHPHILHLYREAAASPQVEIAGVCEADAPAREALRAGGEVAVTHEDPAALLAEVACDAVAIGDCFGLRGGLAIAALEAGRHVISDKPLCTRQAELEQIERLAGERDLRVGCLLTLRTYGVFRAMRAAILAGEIGQVQTVSFSAQHPLLPGSRPAWFFEPALHGGTLNDIAVHAVDLIPWLTGRRIEGVVAARNWSSGPRGQPLFRDGAQLMMRLDNGGGVLGDVSYLAPDGCGYAVPQYWRLTCHGSEGVIEGLPGHGAVIATHADKAPRVIAAAAPAVEAAGLCLEAFMRDIAGRSEADDLRTADVLAAARWALALQAAADAGDVTAV